MLCMNTLEFIFKQIFTLVHNIVLLIVCSKEHGNITVVITFIFTATF